MVFINKVKENSDREFTYKNGIWIYSEVLTSVKGLHLSMWILDNGQVFPTNRTF